MYKRVFIRTESRKHYRLVRHGAYGANVALGTPRTRGIVGTN